jgi:hypothetical protein
MAKKTFFQTGLGKLLKSVGSPIADIVGDVLPDAGVLGVVKNLIDKDDTLPPEVKKEAQEHAQRMYELEVADRDSARNREIELAKAGKKDPMMFITGIVGLLAFLFIIYATVYVPSVLENDLYVHLMGMIEGVVISNIFAYYYGTSSGDKSK